ncbi:MAG: hypothetical protein R3F29_13770 [Planctomycetota bacterium]
MRFAVVVGLLVPLLSAQQAGPQPKSSSEQASKPSAEQREAPADAKLVERDRKLQLVVDALVPLVEKYAELKFPTPPKVRAATHRQWRELVKKEMKPQNDGQVIVTSMMMLGLYLPDAREIVVSPMVIAPLLKELPEDAPRHHRLAQAHQRATLAHELTHALQDIHFSLPTRMKQLLAAEDDDWLRCKYVLEGHAVFVEERIAEGELGLEDFMVTGPYVGNGDPSYANGWRFCRRVFEKGGMKALRAALAEPPTVDEILAVGAERHAGEEGEKDQDNEQAESGKDDATPGR